MFNIKKYIIIKNYEEMKINNALFLIISALIIYYVFNISINTVYIQKNNIMSSFIILRELIILVYV